MTNDPSSEQMAAREEVMQCEQEIQSIKSALRRLGSAENNGLPNSMEVIMLKVEGLPEGATPNVVLQLSSPVEEAILNAIYDPLKDETSDADNNTNDTEDAGNNNKGSKAIFKGVETNMATLIVTAFDADIPLGSSAPLDLGPICVIDPMETSKEVYVSEIPIAIVPPDSAAVTSAPAEAVASSDDDNKKEEPTTSTTTPTSEATAEAEAVPIVPVCTVTLRVSYKPSPRDQREELYELLNKTSQRKAAALETLRKISMTMTTTGAGGSRSPSDEDSSSPTNKSTTTLATKPAVKPGFLNKKKKEPTRMEKLYETTIGPNSILRRGLGVAIAAKNYIIFMGAVAFFHFQGQMLALPPPV